MVELLRWIGVTHPSMQDARNKAQDPETDVDEDIGTAALLDPDRCRWDLF